jgi:hypothetical protein
VSVISLTRYILFYQDSFNWQEQARRNKVIEAVVTVLGRRLTIIASNRWLLNRIKIDNNVVYHFKREFPLHLLR